MPQPWVVSDFDDCHIVSATAPAKARATGATKRPLSSLSQTCEDLKSNVSIRACETPFHVKYSPKSVNDLGIAKAKITELTNLISNVNEPRIILLVGPPGCGKSVSVRCVASSLGFRIREWNQPFSESRSFVDSHGDISEHFENSSTRSFSDFLLNATAYESLLTTTISSTAAVVTIIEEMPSFKSELCPEANFHALLRNCSATLRYPLVFILTSNAANADPPEMHRLFPQHIRDELGIHVLSYNPIVARTVTKVVSSIVSSEKLSQHLTAQAINDIVETSEGDLRAALNKLQFMALKVKSRQPDIEKPSSKRGPKERRIEKGSDKRSFSNESSFSLGNFLQSDLDSTTRDSHSLLLFRALGRVLHCKRIAPNDPELKPPTRISLPLHLKNFEADSLTFDPVALMRHCPLQPATFVGFLQHNAPSFYTSIDDLANLNDRYLSICDLVFNQWDNVMENATEVASLMAIYAVTNCNSSRRLFVDKELEEASTQKYGNGGSGSSSFKPLHAPPTWNTRRAAFERHQNARKILPTHLATSSDELIADYISFARTTANRPSASDTHWLKDLASLGEVGRSSVRGQFISTSATQFEEETGSENTHPAQRRDSKQQPSNFAGPNDESIDCKRYNDKFLETIEESDEDN